MPFSGMLDLHSASLPDKGSPVPYPVYDFGTSNRLFPAQYACLHKYRDFGSFEFMRRSFKKAVWSYSKPGALLNQKKTAKN